MLTKRTSAVLATLLLVLAALVIGVPWLSGISDTVDAEPPSNAIPGDSPSHPPDVDTEQPVSNSPSVTEEPVDSIDESPDEKEETASDDETKKPVKTSKKSKKSKKTPTPSTDDSDDSTSGDSEGSDGTDESDESNDSDTVFYQVDFVGGAPIHQFGPADSDEFYSDQGRLIRVLHGSSDEPITRNAGGFPTLSDDLRYCVTAEPMTVSDGHVSVTFTVAEDCSVELSLVSYQTPTEGFDRETAHQQVLVDSMTETFESGEYTLSVAVPTADAE